MKNTFIALKHLDMFLKEFGTYNAIIIALCITLAYLLFTFIKNGKSAVKINKALSVLFLSVNISFIFQITIIGRIGRYYNGWSVINGDWNIFENSNIISNSQVRNIALFLFLMPAVFILIKCFINKVMSTKEMLILGTITSFSLSLIIELCQGIFSIGTFQFSDLFYNTVGGVIGSILYIIAFRLYKVIKSKILHIHKKSSSQ